MKSESVPSIEIPPGPACEPIVLATRAWPVDAGVVKVEMDLEIPHVLSYFEGHFDGLPLLPGVTQLHWAVQYGRKFFPLPPRFSYLSAIKFVRVITPGSRPLLSLEFEAVRGEMRFRFDVGDTPCSSGSVGFKH